jgi:phosphoribosylglycinamide formyltransferase-1
MAKYKIAILISGNGSNLQSLINACSDPAYPAEISCVISNKADAYGLVRAGDAHIPTYIVSHKDYATREAYDQQLEAILTNHAVQLVCLAGFMRLLSTPFVRTWEKKLINIHPSLLPAFKGLHAVEQALQTGVKIAGCTVHFVDPEVDAGPIIMQAAVQVLSDDTAETLSQRILQAEHYCYPLVVRYLAEGKISWNGAKVVVDVQVGEEILNCFL